ncbi:hypothetical protein P4646_05230 [Peribacillus simplex]|uniref:hypothetical protein n=1 Tax=Peribacillus simplex TaxID=1478 RepID=UPI002E23D04B|nr:hypothetical protein [Peribacillus simplex]MED4097002.1 hypothetical protein [Peribacillus simplex]
MSEFYKIAIPMIKFLIGFLYSVFNNGKQRKLGNRAFPHILEAYYPIDLSNVNIPDNTKPYMNGDYAKLARQKEKG